MTAPVGDVTTPITSGRNGHCPLARCIEKTFRGEAAAALVEERHQRADAGRLDRIDDDLVGGFAGKGRDPPGRDNFQPFFRLGSSAAAASSSRRPRRAARPGPSGRNRHGRRNAARDSSRFRRARGHSRSGPRPSASGRRKARRPSAPACWRRGRLAAWPSYRPSAEAITSAAEFARVARQAPASRSSEETDAGDANAIPDFRYRPVLR